MSRIKHKLQRKSIDGYECKNIKLGKTNSTNIVEQTTLNDNNLYTFSRKKVLPNVKTKKRFLSNNVYPSIASSVDKNSAVNSNNEYTTKFNDTLFALTVKKMLKKILFEKKCSKEHLAQQLNISISSLMSIVRGEENDGLIRMINLPLMKLFCESFCEIEFEDKKLI